ncbi:MAG: hypothetical protein OEY20_00430 [Gemmatimonadota bacterium]|nr:hypothetical protein [Gemmatimonadota bacterium]
MPDRPTIDPPTHLRDRIRGFFSREPTVGVTLAILALAIVARILGGYYLFFWEEDEGSLANGVAALVRDSIGGGLYRYGPQLGYYRFIEFVDRLLGGDLARVPGIMTTVSAVAGAVIPVAALFLLRDALSPRVRWLLAGLVMINPAIWKASQYGNTAMLQTALATVSLVVLSNRPGRWGQLAALALFGAATLVRADGVLLAPVLCWMLWRNTPDGLANAVRTAAVFAVIMAAVYALLFLFDPRMDDIGAEVAEHVLNDRYPTMFWEYLLWSVSPFVLGFAVLGMAELLVDRRALAITVAVWCLPVFAFYYGSTTTTRYFLLVAVPLSLCAAVGIEQLAHRLTAAGTRFAWPALLALASVHLFVGLGHFTPARITNPLRAPNFRTHDGYMPTGALLYDAYYLWGGGLFGQSFRNAGFGKTYTFHHDELLASLRADARAGRTAVVLLDGGFGHAFHFFALRDGATYVSRKPGMYFHTETWLLIGEMRVMTISYRSSYFEDLQRFDVRAGDLVYISDDLDPEFPGPEVLGKLPGGLTLVADDRSRESTFWRYTVAPRTDDIAN